MKLYSFELDERDVDVLFSPIRTKFDIITILMKSIKIMITDEYITKKDFKGKIILRIDKMSRLFFFTQKKYFSISFPFKVNKLGESINFSSKYIDSIDSKLTSDIISLLRCEKNEVTECAYEFFEPILDYVTKENKYIWSLINELIFNEDGYIRYDYDKENENGLIHPVNHYDIFYSSNSSFKIGLNSSIEDKELIDLLDINTNCHFIKPY